MRIQQTPAQPYDDPFNDEDTAKIEDIGQEGNAMRKQKKDSPASDEDCYSLGEDGEEMELNESIQELKKITNVPQLQKKASDQGSTMNTV